MLWEKKLHCIMPYGGKKSTMAVLLQVKLSLKALIFQKASVMTYINRQDWLIRDGGFTSSMTIDIIISDLF